MYYGGAYLETARPIFDAAEACALPFTSAPDDMETITDEQIVKDVEEKFLGYTAARVRLRRT